MTFPQKMLWRRKDVISFLGITKHEFADLEKQKKLKGVPLKRGGRKYYYAEDVKEILNRFIGEKYGR